MNKIEFEIETEPSYTYKITGYNHISGYVDDLDAMKQAIYKRICTNRGEYIAYDGYGVELDDLFGKEQSFVEPEIERRLTESLMEDDRIEEVKNFEITHNRKIYYVYFEVVTIFGEVAIESEVTL